MRRDHRPLSRPSHREVLPSWDDALDAIGAEDEPRHVARFGERFDAQGMLSGTKDAARCIGYLTKYLTKQVATATRPTPRLGRPTRNGSPRRCGMSRARRGALTGFATASSPRTPGPAWCPARAKARPHDRQHLGYAGRRVLTLREWSGKTLADHRADRKNWLTPPSGFRQLTRAGTPWNPSPRETPTIWSTPGGSCMWSLTGLDGGPRSRKLDVRRHRARLAIFRQQGGQHDGGSVRTALGWRLARW